MHHSEAERKRQDEERLADHQARQKRIHGTSFEDVSGSTQESPTVEEPPKEKPKAKPKSRAKSKSKSRAKSSK